MTKGTEWKLILSFTIPLMIGNIVQQLYNVADGVIVGNFISEAAFAAISTCGPLTLLYIAISNGLSVGVGITTAQYFGAGKDKELPIAIDTALILLGVTGILLSVIGVVFSPQLLRNLLSVPEEIFDYSAMYMRIVSVGLVFQFMYNCIASILRGFGDSKATLYFLIFAAVFNAVITLVFVLVFKWGIAGAAMGTVISQGVSVANSYRYLRKHYPIADKGKHWDSEIALTMTKLGIPIAIQMSLISFGNGAMQRLVNSFAPTTPGIVPAYGAAMRIESIVLAPMSAFQAGIANFTGQNLGAGRLDRVRRGLYGGLVMTVSCTLIISLIYYIFAGAIVGFFGLSDNSLVIGVEIARYFTLFFWILSCNMMFSGLLQGAGDTVIITFASLTALTFRVVCGYSLAYFGILGYNAAWLPVPFGWMCWSAIIYTRYFSGKWKSKVIVHTRLPDEAPGKE